MTFFTRGLVGLLTVAQADLNVLDFNDVALIAMDVQNDFSTSDGNFSAVETVAGAVLVRKLNILRAEGKNLWKTTIYTREWHLENHISFAASKTSDQYRTADNSGNWRYPEGESHVEENTTQVAHCRVKNGSVECITTYEKEQLASSEYFRQINHTVQPRHAVENEHGSYFHIGLKKPDVIVSRGCKVMSHSAFSEPNAEENNTLPTHGILQENGVRTLVFAGIGMDAVKFSAMEAVDLGYKVIVLEDLVLPKKSDGDAEAAKIEMKAKGVYVMPMNTFKCLTPNDKLSKCGVRCEGIEAIVGLTEGVVPCKTDHAVDVDNDVDVIEKDGEKQSDDISAADIAGICFAVLAFEIWLACAFFPMKIKMTKNKDSSEEAREVSAVKRESMPPLITIEMDPVATNTLASTTLMQDGNRGVLQASENISEEDVQRNFLSSLRATESRNSTKMQVTADRLMQDRISAEASRLAEVENRIRVDSGLQEVENRIRVDSRLQEVENRIRVDSMTAGGNIIRAASSSSANGSINGVMLASDISRRESSRLREDRIRVENNMPPLAKMTGAVAANGINTNGIRHHSTSVTRHCGTHMRPCGRNGMHMRPRMSRRNHDAMNKSPVLSSVAQKETGSELSKMLACCYEDMGRESGAMNNTAQESADYAKMVAWRSVQGTKKIPVALATRGLRVVRGDDWEHGNQDGGLGQQGSLFAFLYKDWWMVHWDNGMAHAYRLGELAVAP